MKQLFLICLFGFISVSIANAQVNVSGSAAGSNGNYTTLQATFTAINGQSQTGNNIVVKINSSTTESGAAILNAGAWTSLVIYPTASGLSISGSIDGAGMIYLNGADNVTIDGSVNQAGPRNLIISNTSVSTSPSTSTILFKSDATGNTIKNCIIKGSSPLNSTGTILLSTAATTGNDNNIIESNDFTNAGGNRPFVCIFSYGTLSKENSGNIIRYNHFYDHLYYASAGNTSAIWISYGTTETTINNNSFYETQDFSSTTASGYYEIYIRYGAGYSISKNYIGGRDSLCGGNAFYKTNSTANSFYGMYLSLDNTAASSVQGNIIKNIRWENNGNASFTGIYTYSGIVNIGTTEGDTIGSLTGINSIVLKNATSNTANGFVGISNYNATATIANNVIGAITTDNDPANSTNFYGINTASFSTGINTITGNTIGSLSESNSISLLSTSSGSNAQNCAGIYIASSGGSAAISNNRIANLTNYATVSSGYTTGILTPLGAVSGNVVHDIKTYCSSTNPGTAAVMGIYFSGVGTEISGNEIYNLTNANASFAGYVHGLYYNSTSGTGNIFKNFIHNLYVTGESSNSATISGIRANSGNSTYYNNIVSISGNSKTNINGIYESAGASQTNRLYYNTVSLSGTLPAGSTNKSYALYSGNSADTRDFRNNLLVNTRSTTDANPTKYHYAVYFNYGVSTNLTFSNNNYYAPGTGGTIGFYNSADVSALPVITGLDAGSVNTNPGFVNAEGTSAADFKTSDRTIVAATGTGITTDYNGAARDNNFPTMGAWESDTPLPVNLSSFTYSVNARNVALYWQTYSEVNNAGYYVERKSAEVSVDAWKNIGFIQGSGTTSVQKTYSFKDSKLETGRYSYRLKQVDYNGNFEYYNLSGEIEIVLPEKFELSQNYPNPFNPTAKIDFALPVDSKVTIAVYDITGREIARLLNNEFRKANYYTVEFNASNLSSGAYFYRIISDKFTMTKKMILLK